MERQQKRFDEFRHTYYHERPHETLGQKRPATIYRPSPRPYPETLPPIEYSGHLETRKVGQNGMMRWKNGVIFTSKTLRGEWVGLANRSRARSIDLARRMIGQGVPPPVSLPSTDDHHCPHCGTGTLRIIGPVPAERPPPSRENSS